MIKSSSICDLEDLGQIAKNSTDSILPSNVRTDDFQDIPLWRVVSAATLTHLVDHYPTCTFIVPMTIGRPDYFHEVVKDVRERPDFRHFCLTAPLDIVRSRLNARGGSSDSNSWGIRKAELYIQNFESDVFETHVSTVGRSANEIARQIFEMSCITTSRT